MKIDNKILICLAVLTLIKSIVWWQVVPPLQTPDEQAHFAQLQWYAENKNLQIESLNLSKELAIVEDVLGTRRDERGNNSYTYHPEYKNNSVIPNLPIDQRTAYVGSEAAMYPPLYYLLAVPFYHLNYYGNVGDRIASTRILSVLLNAGLVICAYFVGKVIWEDKLRATVLALIISFQPMVSFVGVGIHPDNLLNLLFSIGIFICLLILKKGIKFKYLVLLSIVSILGIATKQLMFLFVPLAGAVVFPFLAPIILLIPIAIFVFQIPLPYVPLANPNSPLWGMDIWEYARFRVSKMMFEVWPWFWGVFKWLGVTLPTGVMKIITRVTMISIVALILTKFRNKYVNFCILATGSYILYLLLWDWRLMQSMGFSQGIQGRYFFPVIIPIMVILIAGFSNKFVLWGFIFGSVVLNLIGLTTIYNVY